MITNHKRTLCTAKEGIPRRNERIREIESYRNTAFSLKSLVGYSRDINIGPALDTKDFIIRIPWKEINPRFLFCLWIGEMRFARWKITCGNFRTCKLISYEKIKGVRSRVRNNAWKMWIARQRGHATVCGVFFLAQKPAGNVFFNGAINMTRNKWTHVSYGTAMFPTSWNGRNVMWLVGKL